MPTHFEVNRNLMKEKISSIPFNRDRSFTANDAAVDEADEPPNGYCHSPTDCISVSSPSLSPPTSPSSALLSSASSSPLSTSSNASAPSIVLCPLQPKAKKQSQTSEMVDVKSISLESIPPLSISPVPITSLNEQNVQNISWVNPKLEARTSHTGSGVFALVPIPKNEVLIVWTGRIVSAEQALPIMQTDLKHYILQIAMGFYQIPILNYREAADWTNHSCTPNAGFGHHSPIILSAMRDIAVGEEITFDYAMCETDERLWEPMQCECDSEHCRKWITANDWKNCEYLWERYAGCWSPHVELEIQKIKAQRLQQQRNEEANE